MPDNRYNSNTNNPRHRSRPINRSQAAHRSQPVSDTRYNMHSQGTRAQSGQRRPSARSSHAPRNANGMYGTHTAYAMPKKKSKKPIIIGACVVAVVAVIIGVGLANANSHTSGADVENEALLLDEGAAEQAPVVATDVIMTLGGTEDTYVLAGEEYLEAGCHAVDPDGTTKNITPSVTIEGDVDTATPGDYTVTYTATTEQGEIATAERTVHVVPSFDEAATSLPVLMYHYVYTAAEPPEDINANYILDTDLEAQLQYLKENDYYYPSFQEVRAFADGTHTLPAKSVVLTFDDGEWGFLNHGIPLFEKYQIPATSFLICNDGDIANKVYGMASPYVTFQSHTYGMHQGGGGDVGRGGLIHALSIEDIVADIKQAQEILGTTEAVAYPFGDNNENAHTAMDQADVLCAFTVVNDRIRPGDNPAALNRVRISGGADIDSYARLVSPNA